jgi:hypothetical protein
MDGNITGRNFNFVIFIYCDCKNVLIIEFQ